MIKFRCKNCGQKMRVPEVHTGKKGKCPKCKNIIFVPKIESTGTVASHGTSGESESSSRESAYDSTDIDILERDRIQDRPVIRSRISERAIEREQGLEEEPADESAAQSDLPWFVDMFFYPISVSGMVHLAILAFLPRMLLPLGHLGYWLHPPIFGLGLIVIFVGYLLYCLFDCIRDSAGGGRRASNIEVSTAVLFNAWELISPVLKAFVCTAVCLGPLLAYFIITERTDAIFWVLAIYGVIFSPMVFLAVVLFDSFRALNPILIVASMFSIILPYCGLVLLFFAVGGLIAMIMAAQPQSGIASYFLGAACIYLAMVMAHLLGRFYWQHQEEIHWEV
jgi:phage FluMu protein Com